MIYNQQRDLPLSKHEVRKVVSFLLKHLNIHTDQLSFYFVTERKITALHATFFNDPTPTDCITFPLDSPNSPASPHILGEVFICPKTALTYATTHNLSVKEELFRYLIHGLLHLIGYTDTTVAARAIMKRKETACLKQVQKLFSQVKTTP